MKIPNLESANQAGVARWSNESQLGWKVCAPVEAAQSIESDMSVLSMVCLSLPGVALADPDGIHHQRKRDHAVGARRGAGQAGDSIGLIHHLHAVAHGGVAQFHS